MGNIGRKFAAHPFLFLCLLFHRLPAKLFALHSLAGNLLFLFLKALYQRLQLRIGVGMRKVVQIHLVDRVRDGLGNTEGDQRRNQNEHQNRHGYHKADNGKGVPHSADRAREPHDRSVLTPKPVIHCLCPARGRPPDSASAPGLQCLAHFLVVPLVCGQVRILTVIEDTSVRSDPCDAVFGIQALQVLDSADHHAALHTGSFSPQGLIGIIDRLSVLQAEKNTAGNQQDHGPQQEGIGKYFFSHTP